MQEPPSSSGSSAAVRPAYRAGQFYPGEAASMRLAVRKLLAPWADADPTSVQQNYRAVLLPHAGWVYCGKTLGQTLAQVRVPELVIILGPRHTPYGANWSVASHQRWAIPGVPQGIAVDVEVARRLAQLMPGLVCESEAHRAEHCIEVLLPFLHQVNPDLRIVPVVLGHASLAQTTQLAQGLKAMLDELAAAGRDVLLVVSSDMNHFAADAENRRLDALALQALQSGDARRLYDTCAASSISMCGLIPAVVAMQALAAQGQALTPRVVDYSTSAQASGDSARVVGYAGVVIA